MSGLGFTEKKVEQENVYIQKKLDELTPNKGDSVGFWLAKTPMFTGDDGEFMVCQGLLVDLKAKSIDEMVAGAQPVSFAPRSIMEEDITSGGWNIGQLARLEMNIRRGDTYKGKKVRYFQWNLFILDADNNVLKQLSDKHSELTSGKPDEMTETATKPKL